MFFKHQFTAVCDCLDAKFKGMKYPAQNPADRGEVAEIFVKEFLHQFLSEQFNVFRGGKIMDYTGAESGQTDVVLTTKNSIRIFTNKGIYPIETVAGVFSVTATLDTAKLAECVEGLLKIPKNNLRFHLYAPWLSDVGREHLDEVARRWRITLPYKCIFAFDGNPTQEWVDYLNKHKAPLEALPDLVVVNKRGMIIKIDVTREDAKELGATGFGLVDFAKQGAYFHPLPQILSDLYNLSWWLRGIIPDYAAYFRVDDQAK